MNKKLLCYFDTTISCLKQDKRVLAAWHFGSIAKKESDDFSDVDPVFLVEDASFLAFDTELKEIYQKIFPNILLWWKEDYSDNNIKNYAVLFKDNQDIFQYDITIIRQNAPIAGIIYVFMQSCVKENMIFDKINFCQRESPAPKNAKSRPAQIDILHEIEKYWLFAYIACKYFNRENIFKLLYCREEMFQVHMKFIKHTYYEHDWSWQYDTIEKKVSKEDQVKLLAYFEKADIYLFKKTFLDLFKYFSELASQTCKNNHIEYPQELEATIINFFCKSILDQ